MAAGKSIRLDRCGRCLGSLPLDTLNRVEFATCPSCSGQVSRWVFPRLLEDEAPSNSGEAAAAEEGTCYYHPGKRAEVPCDHCGRFLCGLCHIEIGGQSLCPACLENGAAEKERTPGSPNEFVYYDSVALYTVAMPMALIMFFWVIPFTAMMALYLCVRHWRTPLSAMPRRRWRFVLAGVIALAQLAGTVLLVSGFLDAIMEGGAAS